MAAYLAKQPPAASSTCARPGTGTGHQHTRVHVRAGRGELGYPFHNQDSQTPKHFQCSFVEIQARRLFISKMEKLHFSSRGSSSAYI